MSYTTIEYEQRGKTVCITFNRPEVLNAINDEMTAELQDAFARRRILSQDSQPNQRTITNRPLT